MGMWGTSLYANDTTCDVRDIYIDFLREQMSNEEAYQRILEEYKHYIGDCDEPLLWFALAETQWKVGRLLPEVKAKAMEWLDKGLDLEFLEEFEGKSKGGWGKTFAKLREKLDSPMRSEKKIRKLERNPWNVNDVYAYQFHTEKSKGWGLFGKYMIMQKISDKGFSSHGRFSMQAQFIDHLFDKLPKLEDVNKYRLLPTDPLSLGSPNRSFTMNASVPIVSQSDYPKKYLTFLGNIQGPAHAKIDAWVLIGFWEFEYQLSRLFSVWRDKEYETLAEGVYRYVRPKA